MAVRRKRKETIVSFLQSRKLLSISYDIVCMKSYELRKLRRKFDESIKSDGIKPATTVRYQSWIKRYLQYCIRIGIEISQASAISFLSTYKSENTKRQGYFALKYFFTRVLGDYSFFALTDLVQRITPKTEKWRKWWRRYKLTS